MPMKDWLQRLQPLQIYVVLTLSILYFVVQLFLSHITHALTLLVASYHMLCNIIALTGCIITIKHNANPSTTPRPCTPPRTTKKSASHGNFGEIGDCQLAQAAHQHEHEHSLRNTFGWTRIDILTMLIVCIFLAALCFSLLVEAVQTLIHIDHQDAAHHPLAVLVIGVVGLLLNGITYLLIGGYTNHQSSFLHITPDGDVVLDRTSGDKLRDSKRSFSRVKRELGSGDSIKAQPATTKSSESMQKPPSITKAQVMTAMIRDICSSIFVIVCAIIVYFANDGVICKFVDPIVSIVSCITLLFLSYPFMKESCLILLQTIPGSIDIDLFKADLLRSFGAIVDVHDLHIWQLSASKYVSTVHITFQTPSVYASIKDALESFFHDQGITIVTIQPEFIPTTPSASLTDSSKCLFECQSLECAPKTCCSTENLLEAVIIDGKKEKKCKHKKYLKAATHKAEKSSDKKCHSFQSLNVASLTNLRQSNGTATVSANDMKKSISESHVADLSMNPNGRDGKRMSEASLTESCTSDCESRDGMTVAVVAKGSTTEVAQRPSSCIVVSTTVDGASSVTEAAAAVACAATVPEKYRANYAKKLEEESKRKNASDSRDGEANGLLNSSSSGDDESTTQEEDAHVAAVNGGNDVVADGARASGGVAD